MARVYITELCVYGLEKYKLDGIESQKSVFLLPYMAKAADGWNAAKKAAPSLSVLVGKASS